MANISKVTLPDGNTYDLKDRTQTGIFYGTCDTAAATEDKEVECTNFTSIDLKPGVMIFVQFDITNSAAVNNLTLNVNGTGAKNIKQIRNNALSNIPGSGYLLADRTYPFYYDGTYWCLILDYNANDPNYRLRTKYYGSRVTSLTVCYRYMLLLSVSDNLVVPLNTVDGGTGSTTKALTTQSFDPFRPILYYATTATVSANGVFSDGNLYEEFEIIDLRYSFNTGSTLVSKKPVYIVCVPQSDGLVKLHSSPISQDLPNSEDGLYYIYLGLAYDTYRSDLELKKPVYQFKNGRVREVVDDARTVNGHTVDADVPANAIFTDTDTKVTNTLATTTKTYITGTATATTNTGTQNFDTGVYLTTTAGQLNATTYKVNENVTMQWNSTTESLDFIFN